MKMSILLWVWYLNYGEPTVDLEYLLWENNHFGIKNVSSIFKINQRKKILFICSGSIIRKEITRTCRYVSKKEFNNYGWLNNKLNCEQQ